MNHGSEKRSKNNLKPLEKQLKNGLYGYPHADRTTKSECKISKFHSITSYI